MSVKPPKVTSLSQMAFVIKGRSMLPFFHENTLITLVPVDTISVGDLVVFRDRKIDVIHRVVRIKGNDAITKGDYNLFFDKPISLKEIKWKARRKYRFFELIIAYVSFFVGTLYLAYKRF